MMRIIHYTCKTLKPFCYATAITRYHAGHAIPLLRFLIGGLVQGGLGGSSPFEPLKLYKYHKRHSGKEQYQHGNALGECALCYYKIVVKRMQYGSGHKTQRQKMMAIRGKERTRKKIADNSGA